MDAPQHFPPGLISALGLSLLLRGFAMKAVSLECYLAFSIYKYVVLLLLNALLISHSDFSENIVCLCQNFDTH